MVVKRGLEYYLVSIANLRSKYNEDDFNTVMKHFHSKGLDGLTDEELSKIGLSLQELKIVEKSIIYANVN